MHYYQITFRGTFNIGKWNGILRNLYDKKISYGCESKLSPTRDDAGLHCYFERIVFKSEDFIEVKSLMTKEIIYTEKDFFNE